MGFYDGVQRWVITLSLYGLALPCAALMLRRLSLWSSPSTLALLGDSPVAPQRLALVAALAVALAQPLSLVLVYIGSLDLAAHLLWVSQALSAFSLCALLPLAYIAVDSPRPLDMLSALAMLHVCLFIVLRSLPAGTFDRLAIIATLLVILYSSPRGAVGVASIIRTFYVPRDYAEKVVDLLQAIELEMMYIRRKMTSSISSPSYFSPHVSSTLRRYSDTTSTDMVPSSRISLLLRRGVANLSRTQSPYTLSKPITSSSFSSLSQRKPILWDTFLSSHPSTNNNSESALTPRSQSVSPPVTRSTSPFNSLHADSSLVDESVLSVSMPSISTLGLRAMDAISSPFISSSLPSVNHGHDLLNDNIDKNNSIDNNLSQTNSVQSSRLQHDSQQSLVRRSSISFSRLIPRIRASLSVLPLPSEVLAAQRKSSRQQRLAKKLVYLQSRKKVLTQRLHKKQRILSTVTWIVLLILFTISLFTTLWVVLCSPTYVYLDPYGPVRLANELPLYPPTPLSSTLTTTATITHPSTHRTSQSKSPEISEKNQSKTRLIFIDSEFNDNNTHLLDHNLESQWSYHNLPRTFSNAIAASFILSTSVYNLLRDIHLFPLSLDVLLLRTFVLTLLFRYTYPVLVLLSAPKPVPLFPLDAPICFSSSLHVPASTSIPSDSIPLHPDSVYYSLSSASEYALLTPALHDALNLFNNVTSVRHVIENVSTPMALSTSSSFVTIIINSIISFILSTLSYLSFLVSDALQNTFQIFHTFLMASFPLYSSIASSTLFSTTPTSPLPPRSTNTHACWPINVQTSSGIDTDIHRNLSASMAHMSAETQLYINLLGVLLLVRYLWLLFQSSKTLPDPPPSSEPEQISI